MRSHIIFLTRVLRIKRRVYSGVAIIVILSMLVGCGEIFHKSSDPLNTQSIPSPTDSGKPVMLLIIDSLMDKPLREAIRTGRAPALQFLLAHGNYFPEVVSSFPTMSVTIDGTLLTGTNPDQHRIPGLVWYDTSEQRLVNYGSGGTIETLKSGPMSIVKDSLYNLNNVHLSREVKTIHEQLEERGNSSASINTLLYRGNTMHRLDLPRIIANQQNFPPQLETFGPTFLSLGSFAQIHSQNRTHFNLVKSYGLNARFSAQEIKYLIEKGQLPSFTIAYFPELDQAVHKYGPTETEKIEEVDRQLQHIFAAYGSWEAAMNNTTWVVMGDSGQTFIHGDRNKALISLRQLLAPYRIVKLGKPVKDDDQIVLAVNERMAYVYSLDKRVPLIQIAKLLQTDARIDVIAWKEGKDIHVMAGNKGGQLSYRRKGNYIDPYHQTWSLTGNLSILDIEAKGKHITYHNYPDALARLYSALHSHPGRQLVVTASPGYELVGENSPTHLNGGGHGSLHKQDSLVPMIVTGTDTAPKHLRIVDIKDWVLQLIQ